MTVAAAATAAAADAPPRAGPPANRLEAEGGKPRLRRTERRKRAAVAAAAAAAEAGKGGDAGSTSKDSGVDARTPAEMCAASEPLAVPSLDDRTAAAGIAELIAKRTRTLRKLWTKIEKYEEMDKASLNKDQIEALSRKPEVQWALHELEDLNNHAAQLEKDEAARTRKIRQELDRAHAAAIARVRDEERRAAESRVVEAVRSVYALLAIVPSLPDNAAQSYPPLNEDEVGALDLLKDVFLTRAHPENAADAELHSILSNLAAGAEVPVAGHDMTYAYLKPLLNKLLYLPRISSPLPSNAAEEDAESNLLRAANAAEHFAETRVEVADVLLGQASSLHETAEEMRPAADVIHHQHHPLHFTHQDAAVGAYPQEAHRAVTAMSPMDMPQEHMASPGFMITPQGIQFGSLGMSAGLPSHQEPNPEFPGVEEAQPETTAVGTDVASALVQENGLTRLVVDQTTTTVTTVTHSVEVVDIPDQAVEHFACEQHQQQPTDPQLDTPCADEGSANPGPRAHRERQNRPPRRFRPHNGNNRSPNSGNNNNGGHFYRKDSSPPRRGQGAPAGNFQRDQDNENNWHTRPVRHPRQNRPQQGNGGGDSQRGGYRQGFPNGGNGIHRGGYRGGGGFRGGYRGGRGGSGPRDGGAPGKTYGGPAEQEAPAGINVGA